jgi:acyl carrier protein
MESSTTFAKVVGIIKPFVKNQQAFAQPTGGTRIIEDLGVNSARLVDIILAFEDEFGIEVDDESADKVRTLGDAVSVIQLKTAGAH